MIQDASQMHPQVCGSPRHGLISDQEEDGCVLRIKDVIRTRAEARPHDFALIDFASDEGVKRNHGRPGAAEGPALIRERLMRLAVHAPVHVHDHDRIECTDGDLEGAQQRLAAAVTGALDAGYSPIILGGGHEMSFGTFLGIANHLGSRLPASRLGIVNIDAHFDLRKAKMRHSGTPFLDAHRYALEKGMHIEYFCIGISAPSNTKALFDRADHIGARYWFDHELNCQKFETTLSDVVCAMAHLDKIHLSIDLDVLQAAIAPGVSAPAPAGISVDTLEVLIKKITASGKVVAVDIAEYNPKFDIDRRTASVAARLIWTLFASWG